MKCCSVKVLGRAKCLLNGPLLPYAMRGGLATDEGIPLVRFAHAAVRTLVTEPGWTPSQPQGKAHDERWRTDIETMMPGAVPY
jgi:hypothetical protein